MQLLQRQVTKASDAVEERERQCQALEQLSEETSRSLEAASSRETAARQERDAAVAERKTSLIALEEAQAELAERAVDLENANTQLRNVKRQNADLEMTRMQLVKSQKQLEDDNAGLYIGLEAKQQELELVRLVFCLFEMVYLTSAHLTRSSASSAYVEWLGQLPLKVHRLGRLHPNLRSKSRVHVAAA